MFQFIFFLNCFYKLFIIIKNNSKVNLSYEKCLENYNLTFKKKFLLLFWLLREIPIWMGWMNLTLEHQRSKKLLPPTYLDHTYEIWYTGITFNLKSTDNVALFSNSTRSRFLVSISYVKNCLSLIWVTSMSVPRELLLMAFTDWKYLN